MKPKYNVGKNDEREIPSGYFGVIEDMGGWICLRALCFTLKQAYTTCDILEARAPDCRVVDEFGAYVEYSE